VSVEDSYKWDDENIEMVDEEGLFFGISLVSQLRVDLKPKKL
jgi:hypothetical protein